MTASRMARMSSASTQPKALMLVWVRGAIKFGRAHRAHQTKENVRQFSGTFRATTDMSTAQVVPDPAMPMIIPVLT